MISIERDPERARIASDLFRDCDHVEVLHGDWQRIAEYGPYDLLVLDGGGQAKGDGTTDPARLLAVGGHVVIDDFTPTTTWPPHFKGASDHARLRWLGHPELRAAELRLATDLSVIVGAHLPRKLS
ncbi:hypothetical protein ACF1AB_35455 [Streptomyces sp. NPDC014846]|uniref:hypothetical protein n=1 Tax=Streptomyces sp. NPDC014846 TaxID=3364922 RepID=UPI0036FBF4C0